MVRAPFYDTNGVKKGAWCKEEDDKLRDYIQRYGHWNWRELPKFAGLSRCGKSCRLRWMNYLRPDVKRGNYTKEEEDKIIKLHDSVGNKWSVIASHLAGRTDNEIKNYWHTHLKNRGKKNKKTKTDEKKFIETSYEGKKSRESELESILASMPSLQILESSPLSPETPHRQIIESSPLSSEGSSSTYLPGSPNSAPLPEMQWLSEDFWTEPFISDNSYFLTEYPSCLSPYNMDFIYQELPVTEHSAYL